MGGDGRPGSTGSDSNQPGIDLGTNSLTRMPSPRATGLTSGVSSGRVRLRFPVLETFAYQYGWAFGSGRSLDDAERRVAREVFVGSLDLDVVRIVNTTLAAAPTTLGDYIRTNGPMSNATLIHELTHVWQFQHGGAAYMLARGPRRETATLPTTSPASSRRESDSANTPPNSRR
jgi:hypothetical protein